MGKHMVYLILSLLILMSFMPQSMVVATAYENTAIKQVGANNTNGTEYLNGVAHRIQLILGIVGAIIIAVMWLWIGIEYHMANPQRREELKEKMMYALIGTIIIAMAVGGIIWLLAQWIAGV